MRTLTLAVIVLVSALGAAGGARADNPVLTGSVGANDAFTISLAGPTGTPVQHLDAGTYTLLVHDLSELHNFHLTGPGVDVSTPVEQTGDFTFTITLSDGTYTFVCDRTSRSSSSATAPRATASVSSAPAYRRRQASRSRAR